MCDQTMPYTPGMYVWAKLVDRIWWPGRVVEPSTLPEDLESYKKKKKNPIATVSFSDDTSYEIVTNMDKISLYSCARKMEFLEKGYILYQKQIKRNGQVVVFDMKNFIKDVKIIENKIGGNPNIFEVFAKKEEPPMVKINIKDLFMPEKERKKINKKKLADKFKAPLKPILKPIKRNANFQSPNIGGSFPCPHCSFTSRMYDVLKIHVGTHNNENKYNIKKETSTNQKSMPSKSRGSVSASSSRCSTSKKRNCTTKNTENKRVKIHHELLKDWDDEELEENEAIKKITVIREVESPDDRDVVQNNDIANLNDAITTQDRPKEEDLAQDETKDIIEVVTTTTNAVNSPTGVFDFDENADNELHETFQNHSNQESLNKSWASVTKLQDHDNSAKECSTINKSVKNILPEMINLDVDSSNCLFQNELTTSTNEVQTKNLPVVNEKITTDEDACFKNDEVLEEEIKSEDESCMTEELEKPLWLKNSAFQNEYDKVKFPMVSPSDISDLGEINLKVQTNVPTIDFKDVMVRTLLPTPVNEENTVAEIIEFIYEDRPPVYTDEEIAQNETAQEIQRIIQAGGRFTLDFVGDAYYEHQ